MSEFLRFVTTAEDAGMAQQSKLPTTSWISFEILDKSCNHTMMSDDGMDRSQVLLDDDADGYGCDDEVGPMMSSSTAGNLMISPNHKRRSVTRRRRRSSARFLHHLGNRNAILNGIGGDDDDDDCGGAGLIDDDTDDVLNSTQNINSVYKQAIRMNAENKINASNSWNLSLIDHLDRVTMSSRGASASSSSVGSSGRTMDDSLIVDGVNFTKASCTLDASVKIYSYRVDDVHLTSYKVLANLNRTDHNGSGSKQTNKANTRSTGNNNTDEEKNGDDVDDHESSGGDNARSKNNTTSTLERNLGEIQQVELVFLVKDFTMLTDIF